jgi:hypothetical protein
MSKPSLMRGDGLRSREEPWNSRYRSVRRDIAMARSGDSVLWLNSGLAAAGLLDWLLHDVGVPYFDGFMAPIALAAISLVNLGTIRQDRRRLRVALKDDQERLRSEGP